MIKKSYAKVNIFLKIAGKRGQYHELVSRFVRVKNLYDEVEFIQKKVKTFTLEGEFGCPLEKNTIYKAYMILKDYALSVEEFFLNHKVRVKKDIPEFAGLGGGSSNCATFMLMVNEACSLGLTKDELAKIGTKIGADVPFFVYEYDSANVTGIGENVVKFEEKILNIETITPKIECDTGKIFTSFRKKFYNEISKKEAMNLLEKTSEEIMNNYNINEANDLYLPALDAYKELENYAKKEWFFSGSGSSFFRIKK